MKKLFSLLLVVAAVSLASCNKNHYLSEDETKEFEELINPTPRDIVFIHNNDIWMLTNPGEAPRQLTETPQDLKSEPRISPDHTRVAYLDKSSHPVIVDVLSGDTLITYPKMTYNRNYDWIPDASAGGLYGLVGDKILFTETSLENPSLSFAGNAWHSAAFDVSGNFYFLITENSDVDQIVKLYRWEKSTTKIKRLTLDKPLTNPQNSIIMCSRNGDVLLKTAFMGGPAYDAYYVFPVGSLKSTIKVQQNGMADVRYNGAIKQGLIYGLNPGKLAVGMTVKNHQGYARSEDRFLDSSKVKTNVVYFDWK